MRHKDWPNARDSFQQIFDGHNPAIAVCLGFIYDQKASTLYNQEKAIEYYAIAANGDDAYAQYALGGILLEKGERLGRLIGMPAAALLATQIARTWLIASIKTKKTIRKQEYFLSVR